MSIIKGKTNVVAGFGGTKRPLGEVYLSQSSLATDNQGALPGWTGEYYENGKTLFPDLYNFVKAHSELQVTKTDYDNAIATYGECKKYVVDEVVGSLRLPKYSRSHGTVIKEKKPTSTDPTWYRQWSDGWLEQGARYETSINIENITFFKPFASVPLVLTSVQSTSRTSYNDFGFDVYNLTTTGFTKQDLRTVGMGWGWEAKGQGADGAQENTLYPWISAYTSAIPASVAQAAEFTGALSGKANTDLSNVLANIDYVVESKVPTESDPNWYEVWKSGKIRQGGTNQTAGELGTQYTFLKPFASGTYTLIATPILVFDKTIVITEKTATTYKLAFSSSYSGYYDWVAEGQGASTGGGVTPEPEPTVLHKYKWDTNRGAYCYTDLSRKEIRSLTDTYPKTPAYIESDSNTRINSNHIPTLTADGSIWRVSATACVLGTDTGTNPKISLTYLGNILYPNNPFIDD